MTAKPNRYRVRCCATQRFVSLDLVKGDGTPEFTVLSGRGDAYPRELAVQVGEWYEETTGNEYQIEEAAHA